MCTRLCQGMTLLGMLKSFSVTSKPYQSYIDVTSKRLYINDLRLYLTAAQIGQAVKLLNLNGIKIYNDRKIIFYTRKLGNFRPRQSLPTFELKVYPDTIPFN